MESIERNFVHASFRAYWAGGKDRFEDETTREIAAALEQEPGGFLAAIQREATKQRLIGETGQAREWGVSRGLTLIVDGEVLWGKGRPLLESQPRERRAGAREMRHD